MLHRLVFLVGLHGGELVFELRQAGLVDGGFLFCLAARLLTGFEALLGGVDRLFRAGEARLGIRDPLRMRGDAPPRLLDRALQVLELYQVFEIRRHSIMSGPAWIRTRDQPIMSRPL